MKLRWTAAALREHDGIYDYIDADNPQAAVALDALIEEGAQRLVAHPALGRPGRAANTREWVAHPNYILIYKADAKEVRVVRVLHSASRWPV